jgi:phosphoribosyl 1,2-cyclic phosphodiesterase
MKFCLLASGSRGNSVWIEDAGSACLVDNGLPLSQFMSRCREASLRPSILSAIFVTHEHCDHLNGVGPLARELGVLVYTSPKLMDKKAGSIGPVRHRPIGPGDEVQEGPLSVRAFPASHDTVDPMVFVVSSGGRQLGIATDLGYVSAAVRDNFFNLDSLVLEFNHDEEMLRNGGYPAFLKRRVMGRKGHLSNREAAEFLSQVNHGRLKTVVLAHLSENNNTPELALQAARGCFKGRPSSPCIHVAGQHGPTPVFDV